MSLSAGDRLGPYEILASIGKGGMGEVFRARDPRLGRDVAIKVSQEKFTERFEREARTIASLNHPNVCTLHDIGPNFLVMELVEGESLQGPLPLELALNYARQIAAALDYAHAKGIIHRDLKPGNIIITPDGAVKVLDFGLAKVAMPSVADSENSPTLSMAATQAGVILGTAAYMAPEQAKGKTVDKRADIWAFGVVLYEMLTGERLFKGEDISEILAGVIKEKPDLSAVPDKIRPLLERCLEKDPRLRLRDIGDFDLLLAVSPEAAPAKSRSSAMLSTIAAAATIGFVVVSYAHFRESPPTPPTLVKFEIAPPNKTVLRKFSVSPDGRMVAFNADSFEGLGGLWVRSIDSLESKRVAEADIEPPMFFWSPDSHYIAYPISNKIMKADVTGGPAETVCELKSTLAVGGSWNRDGTIIFGTYQGSLWRVPATGGEPSPLTTRDASRQDQSHVSPFFLPDGKHFLYLRLSSVPANSGIYIGSLDEKPSAQSMKRLVASDFAPVYVPSNPSSGYLMFSRDGTIMVQTLDVTKLELVGEPIRIADHIRSEFEFGGFAASDNGVLAYRTGGGGNGSVQLTWFDRKGTAGAATASGADFDFSLSPDAASVAVHRVASGINGDIWRLDFARNTSTLLTSNPGDEYDPVWSSDGSHVLYAANRAEGEGLYQRPSTGAGTEELLLPPAHSLRDLNDPSRDGKYLLYSELNSKGKLELWTLSMTAKDTNETRTPSIYLTSDFNEWNGQFSPDGHWVAYVSDETGRPEIYIQPFPLDARSSSRITVSSNGGTMPRWRDKELFFLANGRQIMAADVTYAPSLKVALPHLLFETAVPGVGGTTFVWDVTADGKRFLIPKPASAENVPQTPITVVLNWPSLLKK